MTTKQITISERETAVLKVLVEVFENDANCMFFRGIKSRMDSKEKLEIPQIRKACRSLARKGLAKYVRGLFDEDGMVAGSGYCATHEGADLIKSAERDEEMKESQEKLL